MYWEECLATEAIWAPGLYLLIVSLDSMGVFLRQITVCSQIVVLDQREERSKRVSPGSYRAGRVICRDGYGWCWGADRRGGNHVRCTDLGPVSIGCSRAGRPVVYEPMMVPEDLVSVSSRDILLFLSCFIFCTGADDGRCGMGRSDVVHP